MNQNFEVKMNVFPIIAALSSGQTLNKSEFIELINGCLSTKNSFYLKKKATEVTTSVFDKNIYVRALIEITNYCKNNCYYCGISAKSPVQRYRMSHDDIIKTIRTAYNVGYRTAVLQGGEDGFLTDTFLQNLIYTIKSEFPDIAVTISLGERSRESYQNLFDAGADRYLLRHETADKSHYEFLHPSSMSFDYRMRCLYDLKEIGYQVGAGFMVGSPGQTIEHLSKDLLFIQDFKPEMCGIGPFIPHKDTKFKSYPHGDLNLTLILLSIIRLINHNILLPATTALATVDANGYEKGVLSGANVIMRTMTPASLREKYLLYDNKTQPPESPEAGYSDLCKQMQNIGYSVVVSRGDHQDFI